MKLLCRRHRARLHRRARALLDVMDSVNIAIDRRFVTNNRMETPNVYAAGTALSWIPSGMDSTVSTREGKAAGANAAGGVACVVLLLVLSIQWKRNYLHRGSLQRRGHLEFPLMRHNSGSQTSWGKLGYILREIPRLLHGAENFNT